MRLHESLVQTRGPALTTDEPVRAVEARVGRLPNEYREFLLEQNGAELKRCSFGDDHDVRALWGIGFAPDYELLRETGEDLEQPAWVLPIGEDVFGNRFCIATGGDMAGQVLFWDHELHSDEALTPVAASFADFVAGLRVEPEVDLDQPPAGGYLGGALSGVITSIQSDVEAFVAGRRSAANTKAWCRARIGPLLNELSRRHTRGLRRALAGVDAAEAPADLVAAMRALVPELEGLMPAWIAAERTGWALDQLYLDEQAARPADTSPRVQ